MRVLIVHSIYRPHKKGGAEVVVETFVDELKKTHDVMVLTSERRGSNVNNATSDEPQISVEDGVTVMRFAPWNIFSIYDLESKPMWLRVIWHAFDVWNVHSWFVMRRILRQYQPDVVWTHTLKGIGYLAMKAIYAWKKKKLKKKKKIVNQTIDFGSRKQKEQKKSFWSFGFLSSFLDAPRESTTVSSARGNNGGRASWIFTPHNEEYVFQFGYGLPPFTIGLVERLTMFFTRWFTKGPDLIFSPSKQIQDFYRGLGFWKGVEGSWDWPVFASRRIKNSELRIQNTKFTFGYLGQLEEHKGVRALIEAFTTYPNPDVRLLVAGRGGLIELCRQVSRQDHRIELFGEYCRDELGVLFQRIHALVVPSLVRDNMPTVILEAFAHGRPVIGSRLGGIPEALSGGKGVLLKGFGQRDFHAAFDEIQELDVYQKLVENIQNWKPLSVDESLKRIGF